MTASTICMHGVVCQTTVTYKVLYLKKKGGGWRGIHTTSDYGKTSHKSSREQGAQKCGYESLLLWQNDRDYPDKILTSVRVLIWNISH